MQSWYGQATRYNNYYVFIKPMVWPDHQPTSIEFVIHIDVQLGNVISTVVCVFS